MSWMFAKNIASDMILNAQIEIGGVTVKTMRPCVICGKFFECPEIITGIGYCDMCYINNPNKKK